MRVFQEVGMKNGNGAAKIILGLAAAGMLLAGNWRKVSAGPDAQGSTSPGTRVLDLTAEALGWPERTSGGYKISHSVQSGEVTVYSMIKWEVYPASYFVYAGNQSGVPFGETEGYQWGSSCSASGDCNPPTSSQYFQFNFDMNRDGDNNIDTPSEQYLGFFCEVTVTAPEGQLSVPTREVVALCTKVYEKAVEVRASYQIPACAGVVCPSSKCEGDFRQYGGTCDPKTGQCIYPSSENCGTLGCNVGTGQCNTVDSGLCEGVQCEPAFCENNLSYSNPICDPADGTCGYFKKEDCGAAGCNPDTGKCNGSSAGPCGGGVAPLALLPLALVVRRPKQRNALAHLQGGNHAANGG
jgi:hypothetical protein